MFDLLAKALAACVISYAIAVLMPSWRALLVAMLLVMLLTALDGVRHWFSPIPDGCHRACEISEFLVIPLQPIARASFMTGAIIRALTFAASARGFSSRAIVMICVAGAAVAPAIILAAPKVAFWSPQLVR